MTFNPKFEGEDSRGKVWSFMIGDIEYILFYTKAGKLRGGDFHSKRQYNIILQGRIEMTTVYSQFGGELTETLHEGQMTVTPNYVPHYMKSLTESWVLEWHELPKTREIYEPYRKLVEESKLMSKAALCEGDYEEA